MGRDRTREIEWWSSGMHMYPCVPRERRSNVQVMHNYNTEGVPPQAHTHAATDTSTKKGRESDTGRESAQTTRAATSRRPEDIEESLVRHLHGPERPHPLLARLLLLEKLLLSRDIPAVALGEHILSDLRDGGRSDDLVADARLDAGLRRWRGGTYDGRISFFTYSVCFRIALPSSSLARVFPSSVRTGPSGGSNDKSPRERARHNRSPT